jgi:hypothetical protein
VGIGELRASYQGSAMDAAGIALHAGMVFLQFIRPVMLYDGARVHQSIVPLHAGSARSLPRTCPDLPFEPLHGNLAPPVPHEVHPLPFDGLTVASRMYFSRSRPDVP